MKTTILITSVLLGGTAFFLNAQEEADSGSGRSRYALPDGTRRGGADRIRVRTFDAGDSSMWLGGCSGAGDSSMWLGDEVPQSSLEDPIEEVDEVLVEDPMEPEQSLEIEVGIEDEIEQVTEQETEIEAVPILEEDEGAESVGARESSDEPSLRELLREVRQLRREVERLRRKLESPVN